MTLPSNRSKNYIFEVATSKEAAFGVILPNNVQSIVSLRNWTRPVLIWLSVQTLLGIWGGRRFGGWRGGGGGNMWGGVRLYHPIKY